MNKKEQREQLAGDLRRLAPELRRLGKPELTDIKHAVSDPMLKAFRASLDRHFPAPPPLPEEQLDMLTLYLFAEQSKAAGELVTGLRLNSVCANEQMVEKAVNRLMAFGAIVEDPLASSEHMGIVYGLTDAGRQMLGLPASKKKLRLFLKNLRAED